MSKPRLLAVLFVAASLSASAGQPVKKGDESTSAAHPGKEGSAASEGKGKASGKEMQDSKSGKGKGKASSGGKGKAARDAAE